MEMKFFRDYKEKIRKEIRDIKAVYSDCDGTLFNDKGSIINDAEGLYFFGAVSCLELLHSCNIDLVMISGRNRYQLKYNAQMLNLYNYIAELGAEVVYNRGREVHRTYNKENFRHDFTSLGEDFRNVVRLMKNSFPSKIDCRPEWNKNRNTNILFLGEIDVEKANRILAENGFEDSMIMNNGPTSLYAAEFPDCKTYFYNLMPKGVDKSKGVRTDREIRGFLKENCLALGDSAEDLKMADEVKFFFLMNNDIHEEDHIIKALPNYDNVFVTERKMNRGWEEVIRYLFN
jgi:HAD superfamily hydrolase (TIGR01484 family)